MKPKIDPYFLYGTAWKEELTSECVFNALKLGYRAIDTACQRKHYNEPGVGDGLLKAYNELGLKRKDLFLQTKFTYSAAQDHRIPYDVNDPFSKQVTDSYQKSLENLHTDYIDSYILHGPYLNQGLHDIDQEVWRAIEKLKKDQKVHFIGASNVSLNQLKELYEFAEVKPDFVQIRTFARNAWEKEMRDFCLEKSIIFQGFSLLTANRDYIGGEIVEPENRNIFKLEFQNSKTDPFHDLVKKYQKTPGQIIFKFCQQLQILPITGGRTVENIQKNLEILDFELNQEEIEFIEKGLLFYKTNQLKLL
ncbi:MAG: aldo/keto reductase family protein [Bacteriovoracaceae bacterium]